MLGGSFDLKSLVMVLGRTTPSSDYSCLYIVMIMSNPGSMAW